MASDITASPVIAAGEDRAIIGNRAVGIALDRHGGARWWVAFLLAMGLVGLMGIAVLMLLWQGTGIWGNNIPVTWALDIVSYDWWIGVANGGLLVAALLLLTGSEARGALNRVSETVGLLATVAAGLYPIIHLGRPWFFYWNLPYPNTFALWPQVRSPLFWDAIDIVSFLGVMLGFWYIALLPDLATLRDRAFERVTRVPEVVGGPRHLLRARLYGIAALGWRGSAAHWHRWIQALRLISVFGVILVVSLQTGAAVMFGGTVEPGWHDTLLPVTFLVAAMFAGVGMVAFLAALLRSVFDLDALITPRHLEILGTLLLVLGLAALYCNAAEIASTALFGSVYDRATWARRFTGAHAWSLWAMLLCALLPVHVLWLRAARRSASVLAGIGALVAIGVWGDHFMVIVTTLQHDFLPSAAQAYAVDLWGVATFAGSVGLFVALLLLALRFVPIISIAQSRAIAVVRHG